MNKPTAKVFPNLPAWTSANNGSTVCQSGCPYRQPGYVTNAMNQPVSMSIYQNAQSTVSNPNSAFFKAVPKLRSMAMSPLEGADPRDNAKNSKDTRDRELLKKKSLDSSNDDNTWTYVMYGGIGVSVLVVLGVIYWRIRKNK
jgi:hypothetical protein